MRVFEGGQPGFAILAFDKLVESASLRLSIRSLQVGQGAYLGPDGAFEREPHFFDAERVERPDGSFGYRVGPEIVNYLREDDQVEVGAEDGAVKEQGYWANATPILTAVPGGTKTLLAIGPKGAGKTTSAGGAGTTSASAGTTTGGGGATPDTGATANGGGAPSGGGATTVSGGTTTGDGATTGGGRRRLLLGTGAVVALAAVLAGGWLVAQSPALRCAWLQRDCPIPDPTPKPTPSPKPTTPSPTPTKATPSPTPTQPTPTAPPDAEAAQFARACHAQKSAARAFCEEDAECFAPYRRRFPFGPSRGEIDALASAAAAGCANLESEAYAQAKQCADAASPCVAPTCYADHAARFPHGAHAAQAREDLASAAGRCAATTPSPQPRTPTLEDGEYLATAAGSTECGVSRQHSLHVFVCSDRLRWVLETPPVAGMQSMPMQWNGAIDATGELSATVAGDAQLSASGHITATERLIEIHIPGCAQPIAMNITRPLSAGCSAAR